MKKILCAILTAVTAFALCACTGGVSKTDGSSQSSSSQSITEAPEKTQPAETTEAAATTEAAENNKTVDDYVYTKVEKSLQGTPKFLITGEENVTGESPNRIPQLSIESEDAAAINKEITEKYEDTLNSFEGNPQGRIDYVAFLNRNVLSLAIEHRTVNTPCSYFSVYNVDVKSGKRLSTEETLQYADTSADNIRSQVRLKIDSIFDAMDPGDSGEHIQIIETARTGSLSEENLSAVEYYFNGEGWLTAAFRYKGVAGAESYGEIAVLNAEMADEMTEAE